VIAQYVDLPGFEVHLHLGGTGGLMPVHRPDALASLGVQAALRAVLAIAQHIAQPTAPDDGGVVQRTVRRAPDPHLAIHDLDITRGSFEQIRRMPEQLLAQVLGGGHDGGAHGIGGAAGAGALVVRGVGGAGPQQARMQHPGRFSVDRVRDAPGDPLERVDHAPAAASRTMPWRVWPRSSTSAR
jgi:hypothetical protein